MNVCLLRVLRIVIRVDSDPARQALFANLVQTRLPVRLVYRVHQRLRASWAGALLVSIYGLGSFLSFAPAVNRRARVLALAKHANARREVSRIATWLEPGQCGRIRTGTRAFVQPSGWLALAKVLARGQFVPMLRAVRAIEARYGFLVSCRSAGAIGWYARAHAMLGAHRPGAVLVSSDSQPEEIAFVAAARARAIPQVFVSHAYPTPLSPPLDFSLSILEGEAAVQARANKGPIRGDILLAGMDGDSAPLDRQRLKRASPVIGVFTPKAVSWRTLVATIDDCRRHFGATQLIVRWHPSMLENPRLGHALHDQSGVVESPRTASLQEVARYCDWVIADENSNVHLPVLKLGIPTVAIKGLGVYPESRSDQYGFIANGIVFPPVASLRELQVEALIAFFSDCWAARFARYDVSYLRPVDTIGREVRSAIDALVAGQRSKVNAR